MSQSNNSPGKEILAKIYSFLILMLHRLGKKGTGNLDADQGNAIFTKATKNLIRMIQFNNSFPLTPQIDLCAPGARLTNA